MNKLLIFGLLICSTLEVVPWDEVTQKLAILDAYAKTYYSSTKEMSVDELILRYIRTGRYTSTEWSLVAGETPEKFIAFVTEKEKAEGTSVSPLRTYKDTDVQLPDGTPTDFVHWFAVMNGIDYSNSFTSDQVTLQGWAGDTAQLYQDIFNLQGDLDTLIAEARKKLGKSGGFGPQDLISDLDGVGFLKYRYDHKDRSFADLFRDYCSTLTHKDRVTRFVDNSFPSITKTKDAMRTFIFNKYDTNTFVQIWECKQGIREPGSIFGVQTCYIPGGIKADKVNNHKAAGYAFADYLYENLQ